MENILLAYVQKFGMKTLSFNAKGAIIQGTCKNQLRELDYVSAARALGCPDRQIILGHILPNGIGVVIVEATLQLGPAIIQESGLSLLVLVSNTPHHPGETSSPAHRITSSNIPGLPYSRVG